MLTRLYPVLLLGLLGLVFFAPLALHPGQILYSDTSDLIAEHVPAKRFLVRSWRETGELPLWCPYSFAGASFVGDIQVAMFYPPHLLLGLVPEERVGAAVSWLVVLHVVAAGWLMYLYARSQELGGAAALVAALGYMFAGKWMLHLLAAGHYVTVGLAWLPLLLLCLERAVERGSVLSATAAGVVYGLMALGTHPQWTFYAGLFAALWTFEPVLRNPDTRWSLLRRWLLCGVWVGVLAVGLAGIQLLPTVEAAGQATRGGGLGSGRVLQDVLDGGLRSLLALVGPTVAVEPVNWAWEDRGGFGVLWVTAAVLAPLLRGGRVRYRAGVCVALVLFAFGGAVLLQWLPGFRLFRQPARMLLVATFPVAYLAGVTTQALFGDHSLEPQQRGLGRRVLARVLIVVAILAGGFALRHGLIDRQPLRFHVYWITLLVTVPGTFWLLDRASPRRRWPWALLLLADLWALAWPLVQARPEEEVYAPSACVRYLIEPGRSPGRVLDRDATDTASATPLGTGAPLALVYRLEALRGYNPLDQLRYKEYLQFIRGEERPLRPFVDDLTFPVLLNFEVRNKRLLDLLGVRYLVQPSDRKLEGAEKPEEWRVVETDPTPHGYDIERGKLQLPPYTVYENRTVLPRAFVVPEAVDLPERGAVLKALSGADLRRTVFLELPGSWPGWPLAEVGPPGEPTGRTATVREERPNRVVVDVAAGPAGWLVLNDLWYPGWACEVDGRRLPLYRANYLFRAVPVPAGAREVVFTFAPTSLASGRLVTASTLTLVLMVLLLGGIKEVRRRCGR